MDYYDSNENEPSIYSKSYTTIHSWIQWANTWTRINTFGYVVAVKPSTISELENYLINDPCLEKIIELGNRLFGTTDPFLITNYSKHIEYTFRNQQPSITHEVYIIHNDVFKEKYETNFFLDELFVLYRQGHSELHSIMSPFELPNSQYWCKRTCEFGFVYHHPDYLSYRIQLVPNERDYHHLMTNVWSSYYRYDHNIKIENLAATVGPFTKIMFVMNSYEEEFPESILGSCIDYETPIIFYGMIPYMIPRLPSHLFELQHFYLFPDSDEFYFYILRVLYQTIPESIQEIISIRLAENDIDMKNIKEDDKVTVSIFPEEWLQSYLYSSPRHLVKMSIFTFETNLLLSKKINQLLFTLH